MKTNQPTIGELLQHWARSTPASVALVAPGRKPLTYDAYGRQAEYVCETLSNLGIGRGDRVALVLPTGAEAGVCYVSVCSCATAAPLNPGYSVQEFSLYLAQLSVKAAIVMRGNDTAARAVAAYLGILLIELDADYSGPAGTFQLSGREPATRRRPSLPSADDLALVVQTSGTTSRSKIIPLTHLNVVARAMLENSFFGIGSKDRVLCLNALYHHSGLKQGVVEPLQSGGSTVGISAFGPADFLELLEEFNPTWCTGAAMFFHEIMRIAGSRNADFRRHSLRFFRSGSAPLLPSVANAIEETFGVPILNAYSSSEAGTMTSNPPPPGVRRSETVGMPIGIDVSILDDDGNELPPGEPGEVAARGPTVMRGYEDDSEANAQSFCNGWFRTGDAGYFDESGYLYLSGRLKDIINRGGEKISPAEIDAVIEMHFAVAEAATFGVPHPSLGKEVMAAVVVKNGARLSEAEVKAQVRCHLSQFKVPRKVYFVDSLPRNASGKVQRSDLAAALGLSEVVHVEQQNEHKRADEGSRQLAPLEAALAGLWARVLEIDHVDPDDNFFLLGGDSLRAATLFAEVDVAFGVTLPGEAIYDEGETVAGMAALIESLRVLSSEASDSQGTPIDGAAEIIREISHREKAEPIPLIKKSDLFIAATLIGAAAVACLPRHAVRPALCRLIAKKHISYHGSRTDRLNGIIPLLEDWASAEELEISFLTGRYEAIAETLRDYVPQKHPPKARLRGRAHIDAALAAGRGAVLWNFPTAPGSLAGLRCLADTGLQVAQLRNWEHPFSSSRFGLKFLNPVQNRIEDRYIKAPVILHEENAIEVMHAFGAYLDANGVVRISASGLRGEPYEMPFLGGTLCLALGAPTLAILHDAPLIPTFCIPDGAGGFDLIVEAPLTDGSEKATFERARALARQYAVILERYVKRHPQLWRCWYMPTTWRPGRTA